MGLVLAAPQNIVAEEQALVSLQRLMARYTTRETLSQLIGEGGRLIRGYAQDRSQMETCRKMEGLLQKISRLDGPSESFGKNIEPNATKAMDLLARVNPIVGSLYPVLYHGICDIVLLRGIIEAEREIGNSPEFQERLESEAAARRNNDRFAWTAPTLKAPPEVPYLGSERRYGNRKKTKR